MAASYPSSVKSFGTLNTGDTIQDTDVEAGYDELVAIETALLSTGLAHHLKFVDATYDIGQSGATRPRDLYLSRNAVIGGTLGVTGIATFDVRPVFTLGLPTRVNGTTSSATPTPNTDTTDLYSLTALAEAAAFGAPTGTPVNGQKLLIRIKDNGTARALTWNAAYVAGGTALPSTTVISKILTVGFIYNTDNSLNKWQCVASQQEA